MSLKLFACGDVVNFTNNKNFIDEGLKNIVKNSDMSICNFEAPIEIQGMQAIKKAGPHVYQSKESVQHLKEMGFSMVSLANNHIYDYGQNALENTINALENNSIEYIGAGVNFEEAEDLKTTLDGDGNLPEEVVTIVESINETFYSEIKKTIDFYVSSTSDDTMCACYVTGGSVQLPGLLEGLTDLLGVDVSVINMFRSFEYDESKFSESDLNDIAYRGVVAIGLAMRQADL